MQFHPHMDVPYCVVDGRAIFLDVRRDCYYRLSHRMEQAFLLCLQGRQTAENLTSTLIERGIITRDPDAASQNSLCGPGAPLRSALEQGPGRASASIGVVLEVACLAGLTRAQLALRGLQKVSEDLSTYRDARAQPSSILTESTATRLISEAAVFRRARHYVPIASRCLPDSLSLVRFLAKRGLHARVVFGVMGDPFAAHCWVQSGPLALNETVGDAESFTPIWAI